MAKKKKTTITVTCTTCGEDNEITGASAAGDIWQCVQPGEDGELCGGKNTVAE